MTGALDFRPHPGWVKARALQADPAWREQYTEYRAKEAAKKRMTIAALRDANLAHHRGHGTTKVGRDKSPLPDFKSGE
jgi:hypothetical protein